MGARRRAQRPGPISGSHQVLQEPKREFGRKCGSSGLPSRTCLDGDSGINGGRQQEG